MSAATQRDGASKLGMGSISRFVNHKQEGLGTRLDRALGRQKPSDGTPNIQEMGGISTGSGCGRNIFSARF